MCWWGNHLFVIFAVLDVSLAINLCINCSFFLHFLNYRSDYDLNYRSDCDLSFCALTGVATVNTFSLVNHDTLRTLRSFENIRNCWHLFSLQFLLSFWLDTRLQFATNSRLSFNFTCTFVCLWLVFLTEQVRYWLPFGHSMDDHCLSASRSYR